jgi:flagellar motor component MotA
MAGVLAIQLGENPGLVRRKLESYISDEVQPAETPEG